MAYNFIPCDRDQVFLMPPSLRDWVGEDELPWFVVAANMKPDHSTIARFRRKNLEQTRTTWRSSKISSRRSHAPDFRRAR